MHAHQAAMSGSQSLFQSVKVFTCQPVIVIGKRLNRTFSFTERVTRVEHASGMIAAAIIMKRLILTFSKQKLIYVPSKRMIG